MNRLVFYDIYFCNQLYEPSGPVVLEGASFFFYRIWYSRICSR